MSVVAIIVGLLAALLVALIMLDTVYNGYRNHTWWRLNAVEVGQLHAITAVISAAAGVTAALLIG